MCIETLHTWRCKFFTNHKAVVVSEVLLLSTIIYFFDIFFKLWGYWILKFCAATIKENPLKSVNFRGFLVRVTGVEPAWPWSQTKCLTDRLHPDIQFWVIIPRSGRKSKFFLSVVIYVVKAVFGPVLLPGKIPQTPASQGVPDFGCSHRG